VRPSRGMTPIMYRGDLVALVGTDSCYVIAFDLDDESLRIVLLMCVFVANECGRAHDATLLNEQAESWARAMCEAAISRPRSR
jgi:hypothetical protein